MRFTKGCRSFMIVIIGIMVVLTAQMLADDKAIAFETVAQGAISYYRYSEMNSNGTDLIIKDAKAWAWFWGLHTGGISPPPPLPEIDFELEMIIVAILGWQPTGGGPAITIEEVAINSDCNCLRVQILDITCQGSLHVITNPFHIIKLPRLPLESIRFDHHKPEAAE